MDEFEFTKSYFPKLFGNFNAQSRKLFKFNLFPVKFEIGEIYNKPFPDLNFQVSRSNLIGLKIAQSLNYPLKNRL